MKRLFLIYLGCALSFISGSLASADSLCHPSPCENEWGGFEKEKCKEASDWIALGKITEVQDNEFKFPANTKQTYFRFVVSRWEKTGGTRKSEYVFQVGRCQNRQEPIDDPNLLIRMYGSSKKTSGLIPGDQYYFLEPAD